MDKTAPRIAPTHGTKRPEPSACLPDRERDGGGGGGVQRRQCHKLVLLCIPSHLRRVSERSRLSGGGIMEAGITMITRKRERDVDFVSQLWRLNSKWCMHLSRARVCQYH